MSQLRSVKIYRYIPYEADESFDKVESSNSRSRTAPYTILQQKQLAQSQCNSGSPQVVDNLAQILPRKPASKLPLICPGMWSRQCEKCSQKLDCLGSALGTRMCRDSQIKGVMVLGTSEDNSIEYVVEYENLRFEKFTSEALRKWHIQEMVNCLQQTVFTEQLLSAP